MDDFHSYFILLPCVNNRRMVNESERARASWYYFSYFLHCGMVRILEFESIHFNVLTFRQAQLDAVYFMQVRGSLMIMAMKLISFSFDAENCSITERVAYIFNPSTILFGPFISFRMFRKILLAPVSFKDLDYKIKSILEQPVSCKFYVCNLCRLRFGLCTLLHLLC